MSMRAVDNIAHDYVFNESLMLELIPIRSSSLTRGGLSLIQGRLRLVIAIKIKHLNIRTDTYQVRIVTSEIPM